MDVRHTIFLGILFLTGCASHIQTPPLPPLPPPELDIRTAVAPKPKSPPSQPSLPSEHSEPISPPEPSTDPHLSQTYITSTLQISDTQFEVKLQWPSTAYDQLVAASADRIITFHAINYGSLGNMVDEINGIKNSSEIKKYWIYYINGKKAQIGASQYFIQKGDVITWKYEDEE